MKRISFIALLGAFSLSTLLIGCLPSPTPSPTPTATPVAEEEPLYLAIIWHQHQPLYYKDPETGIYQRPWVRVHAAKDYYDMVAMLEEYPIVHVTFNLTPTLIRQIDDLLAGARDLYWAMTEKPANQLTEEEKCFILTRFFDANWDHVIARFPRYLELLDKRGRDASEETIAKALETFTEHDYRDLQIWFNLAWSDPDFLAEEPLRGLVERGRGFSEEDKRIVLDKHLEILEMVLPKHAELQRAGQIEITMTPYAHPILPLLYDTDLAQVAIPNIQLPQQRFSHPQDAIAQVELGIQFYKAHFGTMPRGMWPAEGSVAQQIVKMVSDAGLLWMASDEEVLARSIGLENFTRNNRETVREADQLYRPYYVSFRDQRPVAIIFRDHLLSDKVGFTYSGLPGKVAARDFINRLHAMKEQLEAQGSQGPHLVTVLLDGENAWEWYENDGKEFLHALYQGLSEDWAIQTVTPSEYLALYPDQPQIEELWPGSWIDHNFATWIGEEEENRAWDYLWRTREMVAQYDLYHRRTVPQETLDRALEAIYAAEGSDWFWWYGADQSSGNDDSFDLMFRNTLMDVYRILDEPVPDFLYVPIIPRASASPVRQMQASLSPTIDGIASEEEWEQAAYFQETGEIISGLYYGLDAKNLYLRLDAAQDWSRLGENLHMATYLAVPGAEYFNGFSRYGATSDPRTILGFGATHEAGVSLEEPKIRSWIAQATEGGDWEEIAQLSVFALQGKVLEMAIPYQLLGELEPGDSISLAFVVSQDGRDIALVPQRGPVRIMLPDLGQTTVLLDIADPEGDDHGPGGYIYPTDPVFSPQVFDLERFIVGYDENNLVFKFQMYGPINNVWGSPIGLSVQAFDVYIDVDHQEGSGARMLLPGRNAALAPGEAWDYAIWVEGWTQGIYAPDASGIPRKLDISLRVIVDPAQHMVTIRVPKEAMGPDPENWNYLGLLLSQEGFPATGVWRIRDVNPQAEQWRFGGGPRDTNHTRIIDLAWPIDATPTQEELLSDYPPSQEPMDILSPNDFCQLSMLRVK